MRQKKELIDLLMAYGRKLISPKKIDKAKKLQDYLLDKYNLPTGTAADYYCERVDLNGISEYNLFIYVNNKGEKIYFVAKYVLMLYVKTIKKFLLPLHSTFA